MSGSGSPPPALSRVYVLPVADPPLDLQISWPPKSPGSIQDYSLDVTAWAAAAGEEITGFVSIVSAPGSTLSPLIAVPQPVQPGSNVCTVILSGGVSVTTCAVTFNISTPTRTISLTVAIAVAQLGGLLNRFGGLSYIASALDPGTASQIAAINAASLTETAARIEADAALQQQITAAENLSAQAAVQASTTQGSLTLLLKQLNEFEQVVEQQLQTESFGPVNVVGDNETIAVSTTGTVTEIALKPTGLAAGTYAGLEFNAFGQFIGIAAVAAIFLLTDSGLPLLITGGAANTALAVSAGSSSGTSSSGTSSSGGGTSSGTGASLMLLETGVGNILAEDGVTPLALET